MLLIVGFSELNVRKCQKLKIVNFTFNNQYSTAMKTSSGLYWFGWQGRRFCLRVYVFSFRRRSKMFSEKDENVLTMDNGGLIVIVLCDTIKHETYY
jgi:hypothetical protein